MAGNFVQPGDRATVTLGATTASGALIAIGDIYGVALSSGGDGDIIEAGVTGVWELPKADPLVILQGEQLYLDTGKLTNVANANPVGVAHEGAVSAATVVLCAINRHSAKAILADAAADAAAQIADS